MDCSLGCLQARHSLQYFNSETNKLYLNHSRTDDELIEKIQELEKRPVEELNDLERIMLMSRPRAGEIDTIQVFIRESAEFRVSVIINEQMI